MIYFVFRLKHRMRLIPLFLLPLVSMIFALGFPKPAISAEQIYLLYGPFKFSLSVEALAIYAAEGKITSEFAFYANQFDEPTLAKLREMLQRRYYLNQVTMYRFTHTPMVKEVLRSIGEIISTHRSRNGFYAIRGALISAAANQNGWTFIDFMRHFPTQGMSINTKMAMKLLQKEQISECSPPSSPSLFESKYDEKKRFFNNSLAFLTYFWAQSPPESEFSTCLSNQEAIQ